MTLSTYLLDVLAISETVFIIGMLSIFLKFTFDTFISGK